MSKFPEDLENDSGFLRVLSSSFQYYIDIDKGAKQFVIRDTFIMSEVYKIPKYLMNINEESPKEIMSRFKWLGEDMIKIINS